MKVLIGIQARSGSTRLPNKAFEMISGRMMLDRVIESCKSAARGLEKTGRRCTVTVLTPKGDRIAEEFSNRVEIIEGPEADVLSRYQKAFELHKPDFLVRITGDCPLIPPPLISYLTNLCINNGYDYFSNVDERFRTAIDGHDCEVISGRLFEFLASHASSPSDREHVTTYIRRVRPEWAKMGLAMNALDMSGLKLSVDTQDDLGRVRDSFDTYYDKFQGAVRVYGSKGIHRL